MLPPPSTCGANRGPDRDDTLLLGCGNLGAAAHVAANAGPGPECSRPPNVTPGRATTDGRVIPENLTGIKDWIVPHRHEGRVWQPIASAPYDRDLELAVIDQEGPHALVFPCRRILHGWVNAATHQQITVWPTHWRPWKDGPPSA